MITVPSQARGDSYQNASGSSLRRLFEARGEEARKRLQFTLLTTDHLDDAMAGLAFLKRLPGVDARRIAVACSGAEDVVELAEAYVVLGT